MLIVDDDRGVRDVLAIGFRRFGFDVWPAPDCRTALEVYRENSRAIGVALLDVLMPCRDGPATLGELRAINPRLLACFMTGNAGGCSEQNLFDLGANAVFWKPLALLEVIDHVRILAYSNAGLASAQ